MNVTGSRADVLPTRCANAPSGTLRADSVPATQCTPSSVLVTSRASVVLPTPASPATTTPHMPPPPVIAVRIVSNSVCRPTNGHLRMTEAYPARSNRGPTSRRGLRCAAVGSRIIPRSIRSEQLPQPACGACRRRPRRRRPFRGRLRTASGGYIPVRLRGELLPRREHGLPRAGRAIDLAHRPVPRPHGRRRSPRAEREHARCDRVGDRRAPVAPAPHRSEPSRRPRAVVAARACRRVSGPTPPRPSRRSSAGSPAAVPDPASRECRARCARRCWRCRPPRS